MSSKFIEFWVRGADGKAMRQGNRKHLLQDANVQIPLQDFLPPAYDGTITLDLEEFRELLPLAIKELAVFRCQTLVREYKKA
jgi:hypothetical protein